MVRSVVSSFLLAFAVNCAAANYTDWWWNSDQSGHGLNVGQQGNVVFLSWFTYDEFGNGMWVVMAGALAGNVVQGEFQRTTGPHLGDTFDPAKVTRTPVGNGKVTFSDLHHATFDWTVNGKSGTVALVRESYGQSDPSGSYVGASAGPAVSTGCPMAGRPAQANQATFSITVQSNVFNLSWTTELNNDFEFTAPLKYSGQWLDLAGTYTSTNVFGNGSFTGSLLVVDNSVIFQNVLFPDHYPKCPGVPGGLTGAKAVK
jgi:hypothetical protein